MSSANKLRGLVKNRKRPRRQLLRPDGKSWYLGIGIDQYEDDRIPTLNNAVKDVKDLMDLLQEKYDLEKDERYCLSLFNEQATYANIIDKLNYLMEAADEKDKLIIFFSGHGHMESRTKEGSWLTFNARKDNVAYNLDNSRLLRYIEAMKVRHLLLISDSCFSGSFLIAKRSTNRLPPIRMLNTPSRWALCSGRADETVSDGKPGDNSPFTKLLLRELRGNQKQWISIFEIARSVTNKYNARHKQSPIGRELPIVGSEGGEYIFFMNEGAAWENVKSKNTNKAYMQFKEAYPESRYSFKIIQEDDAWKKVKRDNNIQAYQDYLVTFPQGRYRKLAEERFIQLDNAFWKETEKIGDVASYEKYLKENPKGRFASEAEKKTTLIKEDKNAWKEAEEKGNISAYQKYQNKFPEGQYADKAEKYLKELDRKYWEETRKTDKIDIYQLFLEVSPSSRFKRDVEKRVSVLKHDFEKWRKARVSDSVEAYESYEKESPNGKFVKEAKQRKRFLKKRQSQKRFYSKLNDHVVWSKNIYKNYGTWLIPFLALLLILFIGNLVSKGNPRPNPLVKELTSIIEVANDGPINNLSIQLNDSRDTVIISGWVDSESGRKRIDNLLNSIKLQKNIRYFNLENLNLSTPTLQIVQDSAQWRLKVADGAAPYRLEIRQAGILVDSFVLQQSGQHIISIETFQEKPGFYYLSLLDRENKAATPQRIKVAPKDPDRYIEDRDGNYYPIVQLADKIWLAKNLNYDLEGSSCYGDDSANCKTYGRLYAWQTAWDACENLGDGWRLPTDDEYIKLRRAYSYNSLVKNGSSGFEALFGGYGLSNGSYDMLGEQGMFWCAKDPVPNSAAWYMRITARSQIFLNKNLGKNARLSCRCVKDLD